MFERPLPALHDNIVELHGHREAGVDLEPERSGNRIGGICVVGGLGAVEPNFKAVTAGAYTERVPFAFL